MTSTAAGIARSEGHTLEELARFIEKNDYIIRSVISRFVPRHLGDPDDLSQEIWTQFIEGKDGRSYLDIYDPSKGAVSTFLWEFARVRCMQFLSRTHRTPTAQAWSIQPQESEYFQYGIVDPDTTKELSFDEFKQIEFLDLVERATMAVHRQRIRGRRDLRWVWKLVQNGYRQDQIAKEMELSEGTISICMDLIREIPEVAELREWAVENGLLNKLESL